MDASNKSNLIQNVAGKQCIVVRLVENSGSLWCYECKKVIIPMDPKYKLELENHLRVDHDLTKEIDELILGDGNLPIVLSFGSMNNRGDFVPYPDRQLEIKKPDISSYLDGMDLFSEREI